MTLILGASGFLGGYFAQSLGKTSLKHSSGSSELATDDNSMRIRFENEKSIKTIFDTHKFVRVVNCIALADIEKCELNTEESNWLNAEIPSILAKLCLKNGVQLIHISTDAVFNGAGAPYKESDAYSPISAYGKSKQNGEINVIRNNKYAQIHRVNFFGTNPKGNSLFDYFYSNLKKGNFPRGFTDVYFSTMYAEDTVKNSLLLANLAPPGIYHVTGDESLSKFMFGVAIAQEMGLNPNCILPSSVDSLPGPNLRSKNLTLNNSKMKSFGGVTPRIKTGIKKLIEMRSNVK